jgi:hypothetical protein
LGKEIPVIPEMVSQVIDESVGTAAEVETKDNVDGLTGLFLCFAGNGDKRAQDKKSK